MYHPLLDQTLRVAQQVMRGDPNVYVKTPCSVSFKLGYPALDRPDGLHAHLTGTNFRLMNCSAEPESHTARRLCTCTEQ